MPIPEKANSVMLLRPMTTAPAARSRATATASEAAGGRSRRITDPAVVTSPATSKRSLIETAKPASGERTTPSLRCRSEASAAASAPWAFTFVNARPPSPFASAMRASASSTSLRLVVLPSARSRASAAIDRTTVSAISSFRVVRRRLGLHRVVVIVHLEQKTAGFRPERSVERARRAAGVSMGAEAYTALAVSVAPHDEITRDDVHLFPVFVHEGLGRMHARVEPQMTRAEAAFVLFVQESRENLLPDSVRIAREVL